MLKSIKRKMINHGILKKKRASYYMVHCLACGDKVSVEEVYWNKKKDAICRYCYTMQRGG
jgi:translation initiation factor 2 beta subunit (eIF-2beta)/eIF-5